MLIDTHCHLFMPPLADRPTDVLTRARAAHVTTVVVPAYDEASWPQVVRLAEAHDNVHPAFGLHPWAADEQLDLPRLRELLQRTKAVAIGEIGLDYKIDTPDRARQRAVLQPQLALAAELNLPVILHCRGAFDDLLAMWADVAPAGWASEAAGTANAATAPAAAPAGRRPRGVLHAFSRGPELARRWVAAGLVLGFGGAVTRPKAKRPRRSAQVVPLECIVLETDAPSIGLEGVPPDQTEPRHVAQIAAALAELRGQPPATIAEVTTRNARRLFGI